MDMAEKTYWKGHLNDGCQVCGKPFNGVMFDARLPPGVWGNICQACFTDNECKLGAGQGQRYEYQPDGRWLKTEG
jgi:hypothetical protein